MPLEQQEQLPGVGRGWPAGAGDRAEEGPAVDRPSAAPAIDRHVADLRAGRAGDGVVAAAAELRVGALLEPDASCRTERDALRQRDVGVLELCLPDRVVGVLRVLELRRSCPSAHRPDVVSGVVVTSRSKGTSSQPVGEKAGVLVVVTTFVTGSRVCLTSVDSLTVLSGVL